MLKTEIIPIGRAEDLTGKRFSRLIAIGRTHNKNGRVTWLCKCDCGNYTTVIAKHLVSKAIMSCGCLLKELQTPIDLEGKKFGRWKVLELSNNKSKNGDTYWKCECECGTIRDVRSSSLRKGKSKSCGCVTGIDITGQRFGKLVAIKPTDRKVGTNIVWEMKCDCGNITYASTGNLGQGHTKSCGCWQKEWASKNAAQVGKNSAIDLTGKKFNRLTALEATERRRSNGVVWKCRCDCGNITYVDTSGLRNGYTKSCGCLAIETSKENAIDITGQKFGMLTAIKPTKRRVNRNVYWKVKCDCGNYSSVSATSLMSNNIKSCGCLLDKMKGENHPRYDPTITDEERIKNRYILGKEHTDNWRINVYERDNFTCQVCGDKGRKGHQLMLNAHHLDGWNWAVDKRFDVDNGVTLCECCHNEFHKTYGYGDNTKEQFEEFKRFKEIKNII